MNPSVSNPVKREIGLFFGFLFVAVFFRFWTFFQSGLDWDESLYMLVSRGILRGEIPYVDVWDNKPVGIYLLYALSFLCFGKSVFAIRLLSCIAIASTCYILYCVGYLLNRNSKLIGLIAGLIYITSTLQNEGAAANTEIFFIPFVATAYYLILTQWIEPQQKFAGWFYFIIGLLLGIAFIIKYVVIYDLITILLLVMIQSFSKTSDNNRQYLLTMGVFSILLLGFLLPFLLMASFFIFTGHFPEFFYANFTANKIRNIDRNFSLSVVLEAIVSQFRINFPLWICLGLNFCSPFFKKLLPSERKLSLLLLIWVLIPLFGILLTFKVRFYAHYFLPLLPPLSLVASFFLVKLLLQRNAIKYLLILATVLLVGFYGASDLYKNVKFFYFSCVRGVPHYKDEAAKVSEYLQAHNKYNDYIYVADYDPVVYFLANAKIPTKYAYPFFLIGENLPKVAGVNSIQELSLLMKKQPLYVVLSTVSKEAEYNRLFYSKLKAWIAQDYVLERSDDEVKFYRRRSS